MRSMMFAALVASAAAQAQQLALSYDGSKPLHTVDGRYVCFNIDTVSALGLAWRDLRRLRVLR